MTTTETVAPTDPKHYVWRFPGSPVQVHLNLEVVRRLQERLKGIGTGVSEEGLLFGRALDVAVEIFDFQPAAGGSVPNMIAALSKEQTKRSLIGYYRTEGGETFHLNSKDVSLAEECFRKPYHVFLMIHSNGSVSPNATFFFHDGGSGMADLAFLEFPFDFSLLAIEERDRIHKSHAAIERSRRIPSPAPHTSTVDSPRTRSGLLLKTAMWTCSIVLVFSLGTLVNNRSFRERLDNFRRAISSPPAVKSLSPSVSPSPFPPLIALHAKRQNGDLELTWSRESALIATATSGVVSIRDGTSTRQIALDSAQVRGGSLLYSPISDQVLMEFTVTTPADTVTESVMVVLPKVGSPETYPLPRPSTTSAPEQPHADSVTLAKASKPFAQPSVTNPPSTTPQILTDSPPLNFKVDLSATGTPDFVSQIPVPPPSIPVTTSPQPASTVIKYQPAVAVTKFAPIFPAELQSLALSRKTIEVKVIIDKNGKVTKTEAIPQKNVSQFLINSAVKAAQLWKFKPATRNDEPTSSEAVLQFVFGR